MFFSDIANVTLVQKMWNFQQVGILWVASSKQDNCLMIIHAKKMKPFHNYYAFTKKVKFVQFDAEKKSNLVKRSDLSFGDKTKWLKLLEKRPSYQQKGRRSWEPGHQGRSISIEETCDTPALLLPRTFTTAVFHLRPHSPDRLSCLGYECSVILRNYINRIGGISLRSSWMGPTSRNPLMKLLRAWKIIYYGLGVSWQIVQIRTQQI